MNERERLCLLLVEDHADLRETLSDLLRMKGFSVESAADGKKALAMMKNGSSPNLVITDLRMPYDGWSLRRKMLEDDELSSVPVIVMSAIDARGSDLQASAYLQKPVDLTELVATIDKHCK